MLYRRYGVKIFTRGLFVPCCGKLHRLGGFNNTSFLSYSSGGQKSEMSHRAVPSRSSGGIFFLAFPSS